jgi:hypothetical protein
LGQHSRRRTAVHDALTTVAPVKITAGRLSDPSGQSERIVYDQQTDPLR